MKLNRVLLATMIFVIFLFLIYYIHFGYLRVNVVFYASIADSVLAAMIAGIVLFSIAYFKLLSKFEKIQLLVIWLLAGYAFAISVPTVIDRSLSFYILEKLQQRDGGIKLESFHDVFTKEYMIEHRLVEVRLTEQVESGTIIIVNGCVKLTERGDRIASFSKMFRQNFLPKKRLVMGAYTDDLTDPFHKDFYMEQYKCE